MKEDVLFSLIRTRTKENIKIRKDLLLLVYEQALDHSLASDGDLIALSIICHKDVEIK